MRVCKVLNMLLFAVLIISCTEIKTTSKWEPNLQNEAVDSIGYSLFVDSIEYVYLETNDSCLIRSITDIVVSNNRLFVFDEPQQTIWVFDREGKYINKICKKGSGPGEYSQIYQFEYDQRNNQIALFSFFFGTDKLTDEQRWDFIEDYFTGMGVDDLKVKFA